MRKPGPDAYAGEDWQQILSKTAVARGLFAQATTLPHCEFAAPDGRRGDEVRERVAAFARMRTLLQANAWANLAARPEVTLADCMTMLAHAAHLDAQGHLFPSMYAMAFAGDALEIATVTLDRHRDRGLPRKTLERLVEAIRRRGARRPGPPRFADLSMADWRATLDSTIEDADQNQPALRAAKARALEMLGDFIEPMRTAGADDQQRVRRATRSYMASLKARFGKARVTNVIESGSGEALAAALATMVAHDPAGIMKEWTEEHAQLAALESGVRKLLAALPKEAAERPTKQDQRPNPAPATYRQAVRDLRTALAGSAERSARLPRSDDLLDAAWRAAVLETATARAGFVAATRIPECRWQLAGDETFYELWHLCGELQMVARLLEADALQQCERRPEAAIEAAAALMRYAQHAQACPSATGVRVAWQAEAAALELLRRCHARVPELQRTRYARSADVLAGEARQRRRSLVDALGVVRADTRRLCTIAGDDYTDDMPKVPVRAQELVDELLTPQAADATIAGLQERTTPILDRWKLLAGEREADGLAAADRVECWACHLAYFVRPQFELLLPALQRLQRADATYTEYLRRHHPRDNAARLYRLALEELARGEPGLAAKLPKKYRSQLRQSGGCAQFFDAERARDWQPAVDASVRALELFAQATTREHCQFDDGARGFAPERLALMTRMIAADGWIQAEAGNADRAASRAWNLLAHARHVQPCSTVFHATPLELEQQALRILSAAFEHRDARQRREPLLRRMREKLTPMAEGTGDYGLPAILVKELDAAMALHHGRLRDVHSREPGGFRPDRFRRQVLELIGPCADRARVWADQDWIDAAEAVRAEMLRPNAEASTTEKCARGFAAMLLSGNGEIVDLRKKLAEAARALDPSTPQQTPHRRSTARGNGRIR
ncbi:MAG: hypothetical protein ACE37K_17935 [Planctomycetota bacterium]